MLTRQQDEDTYAASRGSEFARDVSPRRIDLQQAQARYPNRFTLEHTPVWARVPAPGGSYYAPQFRTDREWYENTRFPGESGNPHACRTDCFTTGQTWPLGQWLDAPYGRTA